jgi:hypothetical protein
MHRSTVGLLSAVGATRSALVAFAYQDLVRLSIAAVTAVTVLTSYLAEGSARVPGPAVNGWYVRCRTQNAQYPELDSRSVTVS